MMSASIRKPTRHDRTVVTKPPITGPTAAAIAADAPTSAKTLGVPPGHLPPVGQCRVWVPGKPPGHQARARSCSNIEREAPKGSWILYRPAEDRKVVQVREIDERRAGVVVHLRVYDAEKGTLVRGG